MQTMILLSSYEFGYISQEMIYSSLTWMGVVQVLEVSYSWEPPQMDQHTVCTHYIPNSVPICLYT